MTFLMSDVRVLLEEKKNISSPVVSGAISQTLSDDLITRDCVTWTPLPTQYRCQFLRVPTDLWITFQREAGSAQDVKQGSEGGDRIKSS